MRNLKLTLEYDGTRYFGWQVLEDRPTIQGELQRALSGIVNHPVILYGSGRTDRGVHALGQVANFHTDSRIPCERLLLAVNSNIPDDIVVRRVEEVGPDFHARRSAVGKHYRYVVLNRQIGQVHDRHFFLRVPYRLDVDAMVRGAGLILGRRDFKAFQTRSKRPPTPTVRTVDEIRVTREGDFIFIDVFGRGFLYKMVRTICGTLLDIGRGKLAVEDLDAILQSGDRRRSGPTAKAHGLCLMAVYYDPGWETDLTGGKAGCYNAPRS